ncbi:MAG: FmdE family protein [Anaerolineae bacterium]|jgi:formylmethanofuran dehydrogenase subunit E
MLTFDDYLEMSAAMHGGCACPGQVLGTRMALLGCQLLGIKPPDQEKRLFVFVEMDRCFADAIAAVSGCRLGRRTLRYMDYGKAACTFYDDHTGQAVRIVARDDARDRVARYAESGMEKYQAQAHGYRLMPNEELFVVQEVLVEIPAWDRPGRPISRVFCSSCGEGVNDRREIQINSEVLCRACAYGSYYREVRQGPNCYTLSDLRLIVGS